MKSDSTDYNLQNLSSNYFRKYCQESPCTGNYIFSNFIIIIFHLLAFNKGMTIEYVCLKHLVRTSSPLLNHVFCEEHFYTVLNALSSLKHINDSWEVEVLVKAIK